MEYKLQSIIEYFSSVSYLNIFMTSVVMHIVKYDHQLWKYYIILWSNNYIGNIDL